MMGFEVPVQVQDVGVWVCSGGAGWHPPREARRAGVCEQEEWPAISLDSLREAAQEEESSPQASPVALRHLKNQHLLWTEP